jgi:hypothetical protein
MALITKKTKKPHRIQFTMSCGLHGRYTSYKARASNLGLGINFRHDFEEWFGIQLEKIGQELNRIETGQVVLEPACEAENFPENSCDPEQYQGNS